MNRPKVNAFAVIFLLVLVFSLTRTQFLLPNAISQTPTKLTVSAAISLKDALSEIKTLYRRTQPNVDLSYNLGSSGSLQQQIERGAPVDIFISAAAKQMDTLESKNLLLANSRRNLLTNKLALIVPKTEKNIAKMSDLSTDKVTKIAIGEPKSVPVGQYTEQVFKFYRLQGINSKLVYAKDVRQVLTYVETGNVNAGFVYFTDALQSKQVKPIITISPQSHQPIVYPIAIIKDTKNPAAAKYFLQFLSSKAATPIFKKYGFGIGE